MIINLPFLVNQYKKATFAKDIFRGIKQ
jgi:hypothetical protein